MTERCPPPLSCPPLPALQADSEDEGERRTARTARTRHTEGARGRGAQQQRGGADAGGGLLAASRAGADPVDLLDRGASRQLAAAAGGRARQARGGRGAGAEDGPEFGTDSAGRMIIKVRTPVGRQGSC